jgi:hypothetical protein
LPQRASESAFSLARVIRLWSKATGKFTGVQTSFFNYAQECHGLQWGFINYAENLHGVQIGLANFAMNNPWFKEFPDKLATGFPFFNWSF